MEDEQIIQLFWDREEQAISAAQERYQSYCYAVANNILQDRQDAEECVNDTFLNAWNAIPPNRPRVLSAFLGTIARNLAFSCWRRQQAEKRGGGEMNLVLEELQDCLAAPESVEGEIHQKELLEAVDAFLEGLPKRQRMIFVRRYWYAQGVGEIGAELGMTENHVSVTLSRLRKKLHAELVKRGMER